MALIGLCAVIAVSGQHLVLAYCGTELSELLNRSCNINHQIPLETHGLLCATVAFFLADPLAQHPNARFKSHQLISTKRQRGDLSNDNEGKTELGRTCAWNDRNVCVDRIDGLCRVSSNSLAAVSLAAPPS
jgi:hypothetical protein